MNVASTYQLNKVVIVLNFKKLMFKAMCNSHQHLYSRKTKGHIQGLLQTNKGRRYEKHFKVVFQSPRFSIHNLVVMDLWFWYKDILEQRKIFYFYAKFGFKLKQRGMKLLYLVIGGYNFTSKFFSKAKDITSWQFGSYIFLKERGLRKLRWS